MRATYNRRNQFPKRKRTQKRPPDIFKGQGRTAEERRAAAINTNAEGQFITGAGSRIYGEEAFKPWVDLSPYNRGWGRIDRMALDEQVKAALLIKKYAVVAPGWTFEAPEDTPAARNVVDWYDRMTRSIQGSFTRVLLNILDGLKYGFSINEPIFHLDEENRIAPLRVKAIRPHDIAFIIDKTGDILEVVQNVSFLRMTGDPGVFVRNEGGLQDLSYIDFITRQNVGEPVGIHVDIKDVVYFSYGDSYGDPRGQSDLLESYRAYWQKDNVLKFWAMHLERFGSPWVVGYHEGLNDTEKEALESMVEDARILSGFTLPKNKAELEILGDKGGSRQDPFMPAVNFHDRAISKGLLMPSLLGYGSESQAGAYAQSATHFEVFLWVVGLLGKDLEEVVNEQFVKPVGILNFPKELIPTFKLNPLTEEDKQEISKIWIEGIKGEATVSTIEDEQHYRDLLGFPKLSEEEIKKRKAAEKKKEDEALKIDTDPDGDPDGDVDPDLNPDADPDDGQGDNGDGMPFMVDPGDTYVPAPLVNKKDKKGAAKHSVSTTDFERIDKEEKAGVLRGVTALAKTINSAMPKWEKMVNKLTPEEAAKKKLVPMDVVGRIKADMNRILSGAFTTGIRDVLLEMGAPPVVLDREAELAFTKAKIEVGFQVVEGGTEQVPFQEAADYIDQKAFWATGVLSDDLTNKVQTVIGEKMVQGYTNEEAINRLHEILAPYVGGLVEEEVVTPWRLETIVRTNQTDGYNRGRITQMKDPALKGFVVAYQFSAVLDERTTDICSFMDGKIIDPDDPSLSSFTPPLHFNCRSLLTSITILDPERDEDPMTGDEENKALNLIPDGFGKPPKPVKRPG